MAREQIPRRQRPLCEGAGGPAREGDLPLSATGRPDAGGPDAVSSAGAGSRLEVPSTSLKGTGASGPRGPLLCAPSIRAQRAPEGSAQLAPDQRGDVASPQGRTAMPAAGTTAAVDFLGKRCQACPSAPWRGRRDRRSPPWPPEAKQPPSAAGQLAAACSAVPPGCAGGQRPGGPPSEASLTCREGRGGRQIAAQ